MDAYLKSLSQFLTLVAFILNLVACATYSSKTKDFRNSVMNQQYTTALQKLDSLQSDLGTSLTSLHKGILLHKKQEYQLSNIELLRAKQQLAFTGATSISEQGLSLLSNDEQISFQPKWFEMLMLHIYSALNYLALSDNYAARVEMLQAQIKIDAWQEKKYDWHLLHYLSAIIYQVLNEEDNAIIAYRKAITNNTLDASADIKQDFLYLLHKNNRTDELEKYRQEWQLQPPEYPTANGDLIVWINGGIISAKESVTIRSYSSDLKKQINIAIPRYPNTLPKVFTPDILIKDKEYLPATVVNLDKTARQTLDDNQAAILAKTITRAVAKKQLQKNVEEQDKLLEFGVHLFNVATEIADTRAWDSLPNSIFTKHISLKPGKHMLKVCYNKKCSTGLVDIKMGSTSFISFTI